MLLVCGLSSRVEAAHGTREKKSSCFIRFYGAKKRRFVGKCHYKILVINVNTFTEATQYLTRQGGLDCTKHIVSSGSRSIALQIVLSNVVKISLNRREKKKPEAK